MLVTAVDQLKVMNAKKQYREAGQLLQAVSQLAQHFADYKHIPKIEELTKQVNTIMEDLRAQVYKDFSNYWDSPQSTPPAILIDACVVIDALGKNVKREFTNWFVSKLLGEYNRYFRPGEESSQLEHTERRFAWLKKALTVYDEQYSKLFPPEWKMGELLCEEFCFTTRQALEVQLEQRRTALNVEILITSLTKTLDFEKELCDRFPPETAEVQVSQPDEEEKEEDLEETTDVTPKTEVHNPHSIEAIKNRYKQFQKEEKKRRKAEARMTTMTKQVQKFQGIISSCFDLYLDFYVKNLDEKMTKQFEKFIAEETWIVDEDDRNKVLGSSTDLMVQFMQVVKETKKLTRNQAFYDMYNLFKKFLDLYATALEAKIPPPESKLSEQNEKTLCLIVNTSDYLGQNTVGLTNTIKKTINPRFVEKVDFKNEQARFEGVIAKAVKALVNGLEVKMEPALTQMRTMPWGSWETVETESEYVHQVSTYVGQSIPLYQSWIANPAHFRFFCDSFVLSFIPLVKQNIFKTKRISEVGAQQLMLDMKGIESILTQLPNIGKLPGAPAVPSRFIRHVQKEMTKTEHNLKVILTSTPQTVVDTYKALVPDGNEADFQRILELKGIPRADQRALMETYTQQGPTSDNNNKQQPQPGTSFSKMLGAFDMFTTKAESPTPPPQNPARTSGSSQPARTGGMPSMPTMSMPSMNLSSLKGAATTVNALNAFKNITTFKKQTSTPPPEAPKQPQ